MAVPRILILGGGGFLGSHIRSGFERLGRPAVVTVASARPPSDEGRPTGDPDGRHSWQPLDLARAGRDDLAAVLASTAPDVVVNCAGVTTGDARRLVEGNVVLVAELLTVLSVGGPPRRVIQLGSSAEYGAVPIGIPIREDQVPAPVGAYGMSKLAATELVLAAGRGGAVDAVVLRVFNPLGAGLPPTNLLARAALQMAEVRSSSDGPIHLGPLEASRDFVDAADVADAVVAAALASGPIGPRVLNVGSGKATQARELIAVLARVAGYRGSVIEDAAGSSRSADVPWQCADIAAAAEALAWRPRRDLDDAVRAVWDATIATGGTRRD